MGTQKTGKLTSQNAGAGSICSMNVYDTNNDAFIKDPHANGEIIIGSSVDGYSVDLKMPVRLLNCNHGFMLRVPNRSRGGFPLQADTAASKEKWMESLRKVIAESTGSPDQSVAPSSYDEDEEFCASFDERMI